MKKTIIVMALLFSVSALRAEPVKDWKSWYNNMLRGLKSKVERKLESKHRVSAVAAVRGARQGEDANALYWKGGISDKARRKLEEEKKQLTAAVEQVVSGDTEGGRTALNKFLKDNPESFFAADAKEALANLPAAEAKPAKEKAAEGDKAAPAEEKPAGEEKTDK
jgi:hypothetical protein